MAAKLISGQINRPRKRLMQRVPTLLRRDKKNNRDYDPVVVSFGPYHHGKPELQSTEEFKHKAVEMFVAKSGKSLDFFRYEVLKVIDTLRGCYLEGSTCSFDNLRFAEMMLSDSCFAIIYVEAIALDDEHICHVISENLGVLVHANIFRDMLLLENQLPFWFLKLMVYLRDGKDDQEIFCRLFNYAIYGEIKPKHHSISVRQNEQPLHFIEAFRRLLLISKNDVWKNSENSSNIVQFQSITSRDIRYLKQYMHSFRSITDLKAKGIYLSPSNSAALTDVELKSSYFYAQLKLPNFYACVYTKVMVVNLIAYEMCPSTNTDQFVTSFVDFMKSLIDTPRDVKELRERGILFNTLGSDGEVVDMCNDINTYGVNNFLIFQDVKLRIQEHYNCKAKTWAAEFVHVYFRSPWSAIGLVAANIFLCLAFLQTYFAIHASCH